MPTESDLLMAQAMVRDNEMRASTAKKGDIALPPMVPPAPERTPDQQSLVADIFAILYLVEAMKPHERRELIGFLERRTHSKACIGLDPLTIPGA